MPATSVTTTETLKNPVCKLLKSNSKIGALKLPVSETNPTEPLGPQAGLSPKVAVNVSDIASAITPSSIEIVISAASPSNPLTKIGADPALSEPIL